MMTDMRAMEELREADRQAALARSFEENLRLMRRGGARAVEAYASLHAIPLTEARQELRALAQLGRTPCSFLDEGVAWVASRRS